MMLCLGGKNSNEPFHLFTIGGVHTSKTFKLLFFIEGLLCAYNEDLQSNPAKKKTLLMACIGKTTINIHQTTIH